jgi:glycerophosphoryl diester phosphodiesterase
MWIDLPRPVVIAHRGNSAHAPENTLAAFVSAAEKGADAIEFDVKLTSDGQVIVLHDPSVDRTTNGTGKVAQISLSALQALDAGAWFSDQFRGERVPTLAEVLESVGRRLHLNIELTNYSTPGDDLVPRVVELVRKHGLEERVLFSSFFVKNLTKARKLLPAVARALLVLPGTLGIIGRSISWRGDYFALHPNLASMSSRLVDRVHAGGKRVQVWTVNTEMDQARMTSLGVDGIITDDPGAVLHWLGRGI